MSFDPYQLPKKGTLRYKVKQLRWLLSGVFPETSEADLWQAVIVQAVEDASEYKPGRINNFHAVEAREYLAQPVVPACAICGVDSNYMRSLMSRAEIEL